MSYELGFFIFAIFKGLVLSFSHLLQLFLTLFYQEGSEKKAKNKNSTKSFIKYLLTLLTLLTALLFQRQGRASFNITLLIMQNLCVDGEGVK